MLILPTKPAHPGVSGSLKERNLDCFTLNLALAQLGLLGGDGNQRVVIDGLNKAFP